MLFQESTVPWVLNGQTGSRVGQEPWGLERRLYANKGGEREAPLEQGESVRVPAGPKIIPGREEPLYEGIRVAFGPLAVCSRSMMPGLQAGGDPLKNRGSRQDNTILQGIGLSMVFLEME